MRRIARFLNWWTAGVLLRPRTVFGLVLISCALSVTVTVKKLEFVTDPLELMSTRHPLIALTERLRIFKSPQSGYTVVIESPDPGQAVAFAKTLAERLQSEPDHFKDVTARVDPAAFRQWMLLFLDKHQIQQLGITLKDHAGLIKNLSASQDVLHILKMINQEMASQTVGELFTGYLNESEASKSERKTNAGLDLSFLRVILENLLNQFNGSPPQTSPWSLFLQGSSWDAEKEGYFWEGKKRYLMVFVTPQMTSGHRPVSLHRLREIIDDLRTRHHGVTAGVTGPEALICDETTTAIRDVKVTAGLSLGGILALMIYFMGGVRRPLIETITLIVGLCWTFGWTTVFIGHVNIVSMLFAPILCGLGVDYGIHWFARHQEEAGSHLSQATRNTLMVAEQVGPAIFVSGVATAMAFLAFTLTGLRGLADFGWITGMGVLLMLLSTFTVLPALNLLIPEPRPTTRAFRAALQSTGSVRVTRKARRIILIGTLALSVLSLWGVSRLRFDLNPLRLQPPRAEAVLWGQALLSNAERSVLSASSLASSLEDVNVKSRSFSRLPSVSRVESALSLLPEDQEAKISLMRALVPLVPEVKPAVLQNKPADLSELLRTLERIGFKLRPESAEKAGADKRLVEEMVQVRRLIDEITLAAKKHPETLEQFFAYRKLFREDLLQSWGLLRKSLTTAPMTVENLPLGVRDWYFSDGKYLLRIYPRESIWEQGALTRFVQDVQSVDQLATGYPVTLHALALAFRDACIKAGVYGVLAVLVLLMATFRRMSHSLLALWPFVLGGLWTLGILGIAGIPLNMVSSMVMPLILGAGVEYGVMMVHRWREDTGETGPLPVSTGRGILLAALTSALGLGMLMLSRHQGIFTLGFAACSGSLLVLAAAILVLPTWLTAMSPPRSTHPWRRY